MALPIKDFIVQKLLEYDPTFDTGAGVPTTGLLIEPLSIILQPIVNELTVVQASQSILTILETADPDSFPEDIVDGLASNAFVERSPGAIGSTVMRIRWFEPQQYSAQKGVLIFRGSGNQRFTNSEAISVTEAEMALNQDGTLYYTDIPAVALEEGSAFNVEPGDITSMESEPAGVANLTNLYKVEDGRDRETNTELIDRIKVAVTVRALVTGRGIIVTLTEYFTTIVEIEPIGFGDPEMMRDIVYNVHIGGNVDVYIKTASLSTGTQDFFALELDSTRRTAATASVIALDDGSTYSIGRAPIDRTDVEPSVKSIDGLVTYTDGADYTIDDTTGLFQRMPAPGGSIYHEAYTDGIIAPDTSSNNPKRIFKTGAFADVRTGMIITVSTPAAAAGAYTVKSIISDDEAEIYGDFEGTYPPELTGVSFKVDDNLFITYEYNPISIDIIAEARSTDREEYTITDVPLMYITSIQSLDPISGNPTGVVLSPEGGFGWGGFGMGEFGIGEGSDYYFYVNEPTLRFSAREDNYIEFTADSLGDAVRVNYVYASAIPPIQAFMDDRDNQSMTADLLARHFIPVYVDSQTPILYSVPAASVETALTAAEMTQLLADFIDDVDEGRPLELSDLIDLFYDNGASYVDLGTLEQLRGEIYHEDGSIEFVLPDSRGVMEIPDEEIPDPTDKPLSPRIARFKTRDIDLERSTS